MTALKLLTETDASLVSLTEHGRAGVRGDPHGRERDRGPAVPGIPAEDLATVGRVLTLVMERANAVLACG